MERNKKIIKISFLGILINILLVGFKAIVGLISNSIAIILDAVNNLSDTLSAIITIIGTKLSSKKPDKEHPFGHGRIEYFTSVALAVIIFIAGASSLKEAVLKIIKPELANYSVLTILVVIIAIFVKFFFGKYLKKEGQKLNSRTLIATGIDCFSDSVISLSTLICAIISIIWKISIEGYVGVIISLVIIKAAYEIFKDTLNDMIGIRADSEIAQKLKKKISSYDGVLGVYDLILHNYGPNKIIATAHIQVNDDTNAREIHKLTRKIAMDVYKKFDILITLGIYASNDEGEYGEIKEFLSKLTKQYKHIIQTHGFYVDDQTNNVSFDVIFSFDEENPEIIVKEITSKLKQQFPKYDFNIIIDTDFSD